jgi:hypothetical protein
MGNRFAFLDSTLREDCVMITSMAQVEAGSDVERVGPMGEASAAPPAELLKRLPPSGRDFEVFHDVVVQGGTTRSAAFEFKISQTRVCQVVERVRTWLDEVCPAACGEAVTERQLGIAMALAVDRLDHLYSQAIVGWRSSEGDFEKTRVSANGDAVTTQFISLGDPRYLLAAGRLTLLRAKLPSAGMYHQGLAAAADEIEGPAPTDAVPPEDHLDRACSENADDEAHESDDDLRRQLLIRLAAASSDQLTPEQAAARRAFFGPVQEAQRSELAASHVEKRRDVVRPSVGHA